MGMYQPLVLRRGGGSGGMVVDRGFGRMNSWTTKIGIIRRERERKREERERPAGWVKNIMFDCDR